MVKVLLDNILDFDSPPTSNSLTVKRGESKRILKNLEKKYNLESCFVCRKISETYALYTNTSNDYVPNEDKKIWIEHYEAYVKSSLKYKIWVKFLKHLFER